MIIEYKKVPQVRGKKRYRTLQWHCSISLTCFNIRKCDYNKLHLAGITTVEDLQNKRSLKDVSQNYKHFFRIECFIQRVHEQLKDVDKKHLKQLLMLRNHHCRYDHTELSAIIIFRLLRPIMKKHKHDEAISSLPKTILSNELKRQALLAA